MKTKIRTFIGLVALGVIGLGNINATAGNLKMSALLAVEAEETLTIEAWMLDNEFWMERTESKGENVETEKALEVESWMIDEDFFKTAESYTASGSDKEIEKYANKQIALENERESK